MLIWEELDNTEKLAIREMSLHSFEKMIRIWFQLLQGQKFAPNWHHIYLCHEVEEIIKGNRNNTIFNVTPGSGKTEIFSIHLPVYAMLKLKKVRNLNISFADSLVKRNSKRVREIIASPEFQALWPCEFGTSKDEEMQVLNEYGKVWFELISAAAGGRITGSRGGYMVDGFSGMVMLDDIDKPDDVFSKVKRERTHTILSNTIRSRRMKDETPIIAIQQRLHTQDSTWFMMSGGMGIDFDQISIPALVTKEYGDSLPEWVRPYFERDVLSSEFVIIDGVKHYSFWPDKTSVHDLMRLREADPYTFESQYQQRPIALGGNLINVDFFPRYGGELSRPLKFDYRFITADTALTTKSYSDFSVLQLWGKKDGKLYLLDQRRGKWEAPELEAELLDFEEKSRALSKVDGVLRKVIIEKKASGIGLIQAAGRVMRTPIDEFIPDVDKLTRVMSALPQIKAGNVILPEEGGFLTGLLAELAAFTADDTHPHDDQVDTMTMAVNCELNLADDPVARMKRLAGLRK